MKMVLKLLLPCLGFTDALVGLESQQPLGDLQLSLQLQDLLLLLPDVELSGAEGGCTSFIRIALRNVAFGFSSKSIVLRITIRIRDHLVVE